MDTVRRECGQLVLHFEPTGRLFTSTDDRERFVTQASCGADLSVGFKGGTKFFNGGTHLPRRGVECLDLRPLLCWQVGVRWIEIGQADYSEPCQEGKDSTYAPGLFVHRPPPRERPIGRSLASWYTRGWA